MKLIYIGAKSRSELNVALKKKIKIADFIALAIIILLIGIPIAINKKIFNTNNGYDNVVLVDTNDGTGSAVYIGNQKLITAAHVVDGMQIGDKCNIELQDPNSTTASSIRAQAELVACGKTASQTSSYDDDYAHLVVKTIDMSKFTKPASIAQSSKVRVGDDVTAVGYPNGVYSTTAGKINNINGGILKSSNIFILDANIWGGNSGGALFDNNKNLIGIAVASGDRSSNQLSGQAIAVKIDHIKAQLQSSGFAIP